MKRFDIFSWQPPGWKEPHPAVIVSHPDRAERKDPVEVVIGSTQRGPAQEHEFILDEADGLDRATLCKCDLIYAAPREEVVNQRGRVAIARQRDLVLKIMAAHGWTDLL